MNRGQGVNQSRSGGVMVLIDDLRLIMTFNQAADRNKTVWQLRLLIFYFVCRQTAQPDRKWGHHINMWDPFLLLYRRKQNNINPQTEQQLKSRTIICQEEEGNPSAHQKSITNKSHNSSITTDSWHWLVWVGGVVGRDEQASRFSCEKENMRTITCK